MADPREVVYTLIPESSPEGVRGKPWKAERKPREYDWEPEGFGETPAKAEADLYDGEWELYHG